MSRCFPFPPPGYKGNLACDVAVSESIKLQREGDMKLQREKTRSERREEKRLKKERRKEKREKKEKEKTRKNGEIEHQKKSHKKRHRDNMSQEDQKGQYHQNGRKNDDQLERSSLTEEHGHPIGSDNMCYSSEGSLDSNKRQKCSSLPIGKNNSGNIFRIRLPIQKHKDPEVQSSKGQPCSALGGTTASMPEMCGRTPKPSRREGEHLSSATGISSQSLGLRLGNGNPCPSAPVVEILGLKPEKAPPASVLSGNDASPVELRYHDLFDRWVPPQMLGQSPASDNQDWLFEAKQSHNARPRRCETNGSSRSLGSSALWPRACYVPDVDVHALPFTVPF